VSFDLTCRAAVVTGGGRGIGLAIAEALVAAGARVLIAGRTERTLAEAADRIDGEVSWYPVDVASADSVTALARAAEAAIGPVDILVNNAGANPYYKRAESTSDEEWAELLGVNLTGSFTAAREFGRAMLQRGRGAIVNVTSIAAASGLARSAAYCAAKAGVEAMSRSLAVEWADRGVRVNCLAPGYVETDLTAGLAANDGLRRSVEARTPLARMARAEEIAGAAVFLASDAGSYVTGQTIRVDGGWTAA